MAIGLYRGSMIKPCSTPIPPAHLISPAGVQRAAAPCLHAALRHSRASASLVPATLAHPNKVIGLYQGSEDQTLQYQEHILDLTFSPVNPAHLVSPAGVQGAASPCLHTSLSHSPGRRSACPCRCEKSKNEIGTGWGGAEIKSCSIRRMFRISHFHQSTLPTRYRQQGSGDANPLTASNPETFPGAAQRYPLPLWRTPKWR